MSNIRLIDTHTHLHLSQFDTDRDAVITRAAQAHVLRIIEIGYDLASSRAALELADTYPQITAVVGIQPNHAHEAPPDWLAQVEALATHPKVVAIGEIGFDFYWNAAPTALQDERFRAQLQLARRLDVPVVIHTRAAWDATIQVLREEAIGLSCVLHSFSGTWAEAVACLDMGFFLSFSGPVTFSKAVDLHSVAQRAPLEQMLIETDSPYLSPHPRRGRRNEPAQVALVAERIATLRGMSLHDVHDAIWENAERFFRLDGFPTALSHL